MQRAQHVAGAASPGRSTQSRSAPPVAAAIRRPLPRKSGTARRRSRRRRRSNRVRRPGCASGLRPLAAGPGWQPGRSAPAGLPARAPVSGPAPARPAQEQGQAPVRRPAPASRGRRNRSGRFPPSGISVRLGMSRSSSRCSASATRFRLLEETGGELMQQAADFFRGSGECLGVLGRPVSQQPGSGPMRLPAREPRRTRLRSPRWPSCRPARGPADGGVGHARFISSAHSLISVASRRDHSSASLR